MTVACVVFAVGLTSTGRGPSQAPARSTGRGSASRRPAPTPSSAPSTSQATTLVPPGVEQVPGRPSPTSRSPSGAGSALGDRRRILVGRWCRPNQSVSLGLRLGGPASIRTPGRSSPPSASTSSTHRFHVRLRCLWMEAELPNEVGGHRGGDRSDDQWGRGAAEHARTSSSAAPGHPITVGGGTVWSLYGDQLTKFDPQTAAVVGNLRLDGRRGGERGTGDQSSPSTRSRHKKAQGRDRGAGLLVKKKLDDRRRHHLAHRGARQRRGAGR